MTRADSGALVQRLTALATSLPEEKARWSPGFDAQPY
jgi:hypothetical protein